MIARSGYFFNSHDIVSRCLNLEIGDIIIIIFIITFIIIVYRIFPSRDEILTYEVSGLFRLFRNFPCLSFVLSKNCYLYSDKLFMFEFSKSLIDISLCLAVSTMKKKPKNFSNLRNN